MKSLPLIILGVFARLALDLLIVVDRLAKRLYAHK